MNPSITNDMRIARLIEEALAEDIGHGDLTTESIVPRESEGLAEIIAKESGIVAGVGLAERVFHHLNAGLSLQAFVSDGDAVQAGNTILLVSGSLASIFTAERTALNFLQRMCGIATLTRAFVDAIRGTKATITDTRKTAPGLRLLDKLAVKIGGGMNHRFGLDDMVLIKDNHIEAAGGIRNAIERCTRYLRANSLTHVRVEVETRNLEEVREVLRTGSIHRIMLDNFTIADMVEAVRLIGGTLEVEASGNVTLGNVRSIAETGVDYVSIGALTHSASALDLSLVVRHISSAR